MQAGTIVTLQTASVRLEQLLDLRSGQLKPACRRLTPEVGRSPVGLAGALFPVSPFGNPESNPDNPICRANTTAPIFDRKYKTPDNSANSRP
jgi:hypothetical protein